MAAKCPKSVMVGGRKIAIRVDPFLEDWGQYRADDAEILISGKAMSKTSSLRETLRHEIMHAAIDICGLSHLKNFEEETIVRAMDTVFFPAWESVRKQIHE